MSSSKRRLLCSTLLLLGLCCSSEMVYSQAQQELFAQAAAGPSFDVVSIHRSKRGDTNAETSTTRHGGFTAGNVTVLDVVEFAYNIKAQEILGVPEWARQTRFDIKAKIVEPGELTVSLANSETQHLLVRNLLSQQFGLKTHLEKRKGKVLRMTIQEPTKFAAGTTRVDDSGLSGSSTDFSNTTISVKSVSMKAFAESLSSRLNQTIVDETGKEGLYSFTISWTGGPDDASAGLLQDVDLSRALREQLGMTLSKGEASINILSIDSISQPSLAN